MAPALFLFLLSAAVCAAIILLAPRLRRIGGREQDLFSVQSAHLRATPRIGGLAVFTAVAASIPFAPVTISDTYAQFIFAAGILFVVGLAEDLGWHVPPKGRLLAAVVSCLVVMVLLDAWTPAIGWSVLDPFMANGWLGIPITLLAVVGISNAFNLIDGVNGLAGFTGIVGAVALAFMARIAGYDELAVLASLLALAIGGFFIVNYPFGLIFLGDAGAYTVGFVLAWFGVFLVMENAAVTPWAILLTMFWPIADLLLAMYRRGLRRKPAMQPDRLHVHQMIMRSLEITRLGKGKRNIANPMTTAILAPFIMVPPVIGVLLWNQPLAAFLAFLGLVAIFFGTYFALVRMVRRGQFKRIRASDIL